MTDLRQVWASRFLAQEHDGRRATHAHELPGEGEHASRLVDAERGHHVVYVVTDVHEIPARIDVELTRIIAPGPLVPDEGRVSRPLVDGEEGDGVEPPV